MPSCMPWPIASTSVRDSGVKVPHYVEERPRELVLFPLLLILLLKDEAGISEVLHPCGYFYILVRPREPISPKGPKVIVD